MTAAMNAVVAALVAVLTERDAQPVKPLLDVMSVRRPCLATDPARQRLHRGKMLAIRGSQILAVQNSIL